MTPINTPANRFSSLMLQPGQSRRLIVTADTTLIDPGTMGTASVKNFEWRPAGSASGDRYVVELKGNTLMFDRTLVDICTPVEDKIKVVGLPLKGWTCLPQPDSFDFLIFAPADLKSCQVFLKNWRPADISASQVTSPTQITLTFKDQPAVTCTHP